MSIHEITRSDIEELLKTKFSPNKLEVINDSHAHKGHAEALLHPKAGHFRVVMISKKFSGHSQISRHRMVYQALTDLMDSKIHALSLELKTPEEL